MHKKNIVRIISLATIVCLILTTGAFAAVLGDLINGYKTPLNSEMQLSKGVYWTGSAYQTENYIEYTPSSSVYPVVVSGSKVTNYGNFASMASLLEKQGKHVIAGINGDYFVVANYEPLGIVVQNGELLSSDAGHWAVGFSNSGNPIFGKPSIGVSVGIAGKDYTFNAINKTRNDGEAVVYTDAYAYATKNAGEGADIVCSVSGEMTMNCSLTLTVEDIITTGGPVSIPAGKVILSVSSDATDELKAAIASLGAGNSVTLKVSSASEWANVTYAVGSLFKLVTNGAVDSSVPPDTEIAPRTAVGKKADGSIVFYTVDGRQASTGSLGISISKLAQKMLELGCVEATIMDGGGSTTMNAIYMGDSSVSQINCPSDPGNNQRSVSDYIMLVTEEKATGVASSLALYPLSTNILSGASTAYTVKAADINGYAAALSKTASLSVSSGLGTIASDGTYKSTGAGKGTVTATLTGLTDASVQVNVVATPDSITIKNENGGNTISSLAVASDSVTNLTAAAVSNHISLISQDSCYTWSADSNIGTITADGAFTAGENNASGNITVKAGEKTVTIPVTVTNPNKFDDVKKADWFYTAVQYVGDKNAMFGTADRVFSPDVTITRAMVVTTLFRMAGSPETAAATTGFSDVSDGQYSKAINWANAKGIVLGANGKFKPDDPISREQLATILYRYSASPETSGSLTAFTDASSVSAWAKDALVWAVGKKLISGVTATTLSPQTTATRAQMAMIIYRMSGQA